MMDVTSDLEALVEQAAVERVLAEGREQQLLALRARVADGRAKAARARRELVDRLERCDAELAAGRDRLGPARLEHGKAARELEALADRAAVGSDPAARALGRAADVEKTCGEIVAAHQRRCAVLEGELEAAQASLAAFDAEQVERVGAELEALLVECARHEALQRAAAGVLQVGSLIVARRSAQPAPKESWKPDLLALPMHDVLRAAFLAAAVPVGTNFAKHGATVGRNHRGLAQAAGDLIASWQAGRARSVPAVEGEAA